MKNKGISLKRLIKSFVYAFNGIRRMIVQEQNAKIHLLAMFLATITGLFFHLSATEWIALVIVSGGVFATEAINTSIETLSNTISPTYNKSIKQVKDFAAGAVLAVTVTSVIVGLIIFLPKIMALFGA